MKGRGQTKLKGGPGRGRARLQREHDALLLVRVQARVQLGRQALAHPGVAPRGVGLQPHRQVYPLVGVRAKLLEQRDRPLKWNELRLFPRRAIGGA